VPRLRRRSFRHRFFLPFIKRWCISVKEKKKLCQNADNWKILSKFATNKLNDQMNTNGENVSHSRESGNTTHTHSSHHGSSHSQSRHHHKHKEDASERMKNHLLLTAKRRKVLEKVLFHVALVAAVLIIIACILVSVFDIK
jgi:hypothetical protein